MPRRNNRKKEPEMHIAFLNYLPDSKPRCYGCAFAGQEYKCLSSDGRCLKTKPKTKRRGGRYQPDIAEATMH